MRRRDGPPELTLLGRRFGLPRRRGPRLALGVGLVLGGLLGFLPVLGFWMVPLGLAVLAWDVPWIDRRWRRARARRRLRRVRRRRREAERRRREADRRAGGRRDR